MTFHQYLLINLLSKGYFHEKYIGEIIIATAILHTIVGLIAGYQPLLAIAQNGFFNSVDPYFDRMAIVWFLMFGVLLFLI